MTREAFSMIRRLVDRLLDWWRRRHQRQPQRLPRAATGRHAKPGRVAAMRRDRVPMAFALHRHATRTTGRVGRAVRFGDSSSLARWL